MIKISAYYQRMRLWKPTGVGKHIGNMTSRISQMIGGVRHIHGSDDYAGAVQRNVPGVESPDTLCRLPASRRICEAAWMVVDCPPVNWWTGQSDWIYCPAEYYVSTRKSRLAVTIHCDNWFNSDLPWHNDPDIVRTRGHRRRLYETIARKADLVLCVSEFLRGRMVDIFGVPEARTAVIGNGVEEAFFNPVNVAHQIHTRIGGRPYVCIIGGLTRRKGGESTVKVIKDMASAKPDFIFMVIGSSEAPFVAGLSDLPNVQHLGYLGLNDGLPSLVAGAVAVLFLSRYETFGIPAIEAMAAGTVPIVSSYGALPEVVGKEGIILDEGQYSEVPEILSSLVERPPDAIQKESLRARAREFTWDSCASKVLNAVRN
jgi:glycosyltransferase involved in cell wall biosynthesis